MMREGRKGFRRNRQDVFLQLSAKSKPCAQAGRKGLLGIGFEKGKAW